MSERLVQRQDTPSLLAFLALLAVVLPVVVLLAMPYLLAVFMGALCSLMTRPLYDAQRRWGLSARTAAATATLGGLLLIIAPLALFLTLAIQQAVSVGQSLAAGEKLSLPSLLERFSAAGPLRDTIRSNLQAGAKGLTGVLLKAAADLPRLLVQLAMASMAWFFLLKDGDRLLAWAEDKLPLHADVRARLKESFRNTALSSVWATLAAASAQSLVMGLAFWVLGIPEVFLAAGGTFILSWIPMVGSVPVALGALAYLYSEGRYGAMGLMAVFGVLVTLIDNVVRPMVLKGREGLHPFVSLLAIIAGIDLFGLPGAFVGPILVSLAIILLDLWPEVARRCGFSPGGEKG